jgi:hypothetical protein
MKHRYDTPQILTILYFKKDVFRLLQEMM